MTKLGIGAVTFILLAVLVVPALAATSTVRITGETAAFENDLGWMFARDLTTDTAYEFNSDEASIGAGSLYVPPIGPAAMDKFIAELFLITPLASIDSIAFDFLIGSGGTAADANQFYLNVYANFPSSLPTKFYDCRYTIVATVGSTTEFTTVTYDKDTAYPVTTRGGLDPSPMPCPAVPSAMGPGAILRMASISVGDTTASDVGLNAYLDNVVVVTGDDTVIYDFDVEPVTKDDCKSGGWADYGFKNQGACIQFVNTGKDNR